MTAALDAEEALRLGAAALARVLDLDASLLRADTPLADLGADSVARVCFADAVEELARTQRGVVITIPDDRLRAAATLGDLVAPLTQGGAR
ncbi:MAG: phosphopantetheine-binding protein [Candidatus Nanopelagicales bacterium]